MSVSSSETSVTALAFIGRFIGIAINGGFYFLKKIRSIFRADSVFIKEHLKLFLFMYFIQHCFICRPSDSIVSEDAGIDPRTVATLALTALETVLCQDFFIFYCTISAVSSFLVP